MSYEIVITETPNGFSAHVPDLPGCVAAAETRDETERLICEAISFHLEGMMLSKSIVALAPIEARSETAVIWTTENTPVLFVDIESPLSSSYAIRSPQIAFGAIGAAA